jgi:hypothetical protein
LVSNPKFLWIKETILKFKTAKVSLSSKKRVHTFNIFFKLLNSKNFTALSICFLVQDVRNHPGKTTLFETS